MEQQQAVFAERPPQLGDERAERRPAIGFGPAADDNRGDTEVNGAPEARR